ncbi:exodeoxyribonuclease V subunit gamma [Sesbania bispinosa]|nr:exodeoxyribonuclease V subunit gamma [Sesbania bispinosa]
MTGGQSSRKTTTGEGQNSRGDRRATWYNPLSGRPNGNHLNFIEVRRASQWDTCDYTPLNAK